MGTDEIGGDALMACYQTHIDPALQGQRLDAALRRTFPELPSWALRDAFTHRDVKVDGKRVKADLRVHGGEWVQVYVMEQSPALDVVYEDANLLLINKRPGISVTEDAGGGATLTDMVARYARQREKQRLRSLCTAWITRPVGWCFLPRTRKRRPFWRMPFGSDSPRRNTPAWCGAFPSRPGLVQGLPDQGCRGRPCYDT